MQIKNTQPIAAWWVIGFALVLPTLITWIYFIALDGSSAWLQQGAYSTLKTLQFALPLAYVFALRRRLHRTNHVIAPLQNPFSLRGIPLGIAFGLMIAVTGWLLYAGWLKPAGYFDSAAGIAREKIKGMGLNSLAAYGALAIFYSLVHSLLEEYYWRWFVFGQLQQVTRPPAAIAISSLGFMAHHVLVLAKFFGWTSPAMYLLAAAVAIGGIAWAWLYRQSKSLAGPWISHAMIDALIFYVGYDLLHS